MLWVRNGYVELTIILNHKNIQHMFTLPFLHTLPIIITNKKTSLSDLAIFDWLLWVIDWIHQIIRKEQRFVVGSVCANFKHKAKSHYELNFRHLRSQVRSPFLYVHLHAVWYSVRLCLWSGQRHLQLLFDSRARSMERDPAETMEQWQDWARCWLQVVRKKHSGSGQGTSALLCRAWNEGGLMKRAVEKLSQPRLMLKASGRLGLG